MILDIKIIIELKKKNLILIFLKNYSINPIKKYIKKYRLLKTYDILKKKFK
jgi:hypothetical protein